MIIILSTSSVVGAVPACLWARGLRGCGIRLSRPGNAIVVNAGRALPGWAFPLRRVWIV